MIGNKLKELRTSKNLTQEEIANLLNVAQGSYSNYEKNKREPDYETLKKIATFYKVSIDYLLDYNISKPNLSHEEQDIINRLVTIFENNKRA